MNHFAATEFWFHHHRLPEEVRALVEKNFALLKANPHHASVRLKKVGELWSARVGLHYRALGQDYRGGILWFWIGPHGTYDRYT